MDLDLNVVVDILKVGFPGLVFLLALFAYKLLSRAGDSSKPNKEVLPLIKNFMYINVTLAVLTMTAPIIDYALSEKSETFKVSAVVASSDDKTGMVSVCNNEKYLNRYLLIKDFESQKLIQVFADRIIPCEEDDFIVLSPDDAAHLGWQSTANSKDVVVVTALPGYKFVI